MPAFFLQTLAVRFVLVSVVLLVLGLGGQTGVGEARAQTPTLLALASQDLPVQPTLRAELEMGEQAMSVGTEARFALPEAVQDTLRKGVAIYFTTEARLFQWQWWYFDRPIARATRTIKLSFQPLLNNYRVTIGGFTQQFTTLREALGVVGNTSLPLAHRSVLEEGERYYVRVSFSLDLSQLPRAQQIGLENDPQWQLRQNVELSFRYGASRLQTP